MITFLKWDSRFFGKKIAKIDVGVEGTKETFEKTLQIFYQKNYDCAYLVIPEKRQDLLNYCREKDFFLADKKLLMRKKTSRIKIGESIDVDIEEKYSLKEKNILQGLIHQLAEVGRFYKDPNFKPYAYKLYEKWLFNSLKKSDYKYFFARRNDVTIGLITLRLMDNNPYIDLFVVDKKYRKRGIGRMLLGTVDTWAKNNNYSDIFVTTQSDNKVAVRVYKNYGFKEEKISYIFHVWRR